MVFQDIIFCLIKIVLPAVRKNFKIKLDIVCLPLLQMLYLTTIIKYVQRSFVISSTKATKWRCDPRVSNEIHEFNIASFCSRWKIYFHHSKLVFLSSSLLCSFQEGRVSLKKSKYHLAIYHTLLQSTSQLNLLYFYQAECMRGKVTGLVSWWYNVFCPSFTKDIHQFVIEWFLLN